MEIPDHVKPECDPDRQSFIEQLGCEFYHETDGACCATHGGCPMAAIRHALATGGAPVPIARSMIGISHWRLIAVIAAMLASCGWGVYGWVM